MSHAWLIQSTPDPAAQGGRITRRTARLSYTILGIACPRRLVLKALMTADSVLVDALRQTDLFGSQATRP
jgi:hypothetical protein